MARKPKHEEHENHERWLVSYADFITLLFAFFVVMYAVSSVNEGKYRVLSESLVAAFRSPTKSMMPIQIGQVAKSPITESIEFRKQPGVIGLPSMPMPRFVESSPSANPDQHQGKDDSEGAAEAAANAAEQLNRISSEITDAMREMIDKELIDVRQTDHWVEVEIRTSILFPSGSATLSREALPVLRKLGGILKKFPNAIHVEGFTDNVPIDTVFFPSNWELSAGRAASVVHLFTRNGVDPERMVAIGYGEFRPVAENTTAAGRRKNRRVVLVIQSTADTSEIIAGLKALDTPAPKPLRAAATPRAGGTQSAPAAPPAQTVKVQRPSNPGALRKPGKFPVIQSPIQLPFQPIRPILAPTTPGLSAGGMSRAEVGQ